jgi:hypothetical protein
VAAVSAVVLFAIGTSQASQTVSRPPVQSDTDIVSVIGNDADAAILISAILNDLSRSDSPVFVLGRQIRAFWLPPVEGVDFVRLSDGEAAARTSACGHYWFVTVEKVPRTGDLRVSRRRTCSASVHTKDFVLWQGQWRQTRTGIGSGWVGGPPPECVACLRLP